MNHQNDPSNLNQKSSSNCDYSNNPRLLSSISHLPSPNAAAVSPAYSLQPTASIRPVGQQGQAKVLLFDFDGTIADTRALALQILNELSKEFNYRYLPEEELEKARNMSTQELMRFLGIRRWRVPFIARRGLVKFQERVSEVQPIPEMPAILRALKEQGFRLGILTSNSEVNVTAFLAHHGIDCFDFIRTSSKLFGKSREMRRLMKEYQLHPDEIIYIGDETRDIEATQEVAIRMAAVTWGYNSSAILKSMSPHFLFDTPAELLAHFMR